MTTDVPAPPDPDMTAAELALGVLDGAERADALRRMLADPAFAREVDEWRARLAALLADYRPAAAPAMADALVARAVRPRPRLAWAIAALSAMAAAFALFFVTRPVPLAPIAAPAPHAMMVAALMPTGKAATPVSAVIDLTTAEVRVAAAAPAPAGRAAQLWMIRDGVPHALGLLHAGTATRLPLDARQRAAITAGVVLAISIEPPGGSPLPTPTGPVVASGALAAA